MSAKSVARAKASFGTTSKPYKPAKGVVLICLYSSSSSSIFNFFYLLLFCFVVSLHCQKVKWLYMVSSTHSQNDDEWPSQSSKRVNIIVEHNWLWPESRDSRKSPLFCCLLLFLLWLQHRKAKQMWGGGGGGREEELDLQLQSLCVKIRPYCL